MIWNGYLVGADAKAVQLAAYNIASATKARRYLAGWQLFSHR